MLSFRTTRRIEFGDTDMAGIVHFANFFRFMEAAECAFLRSRGLSVRMQWEGQAIGFPRLPEPLRQRQVEYLASRQNPDGGFSGREGESDLYYTGFGLRGLSILDALTPEISVQAGMYLRSCMKQQTSVVDFFSFLYACVL